MIAHTGDNVAEHSRMEEKRQAFGYQVVDDLQVQGSGEPWEPNSEGDDLPSRTSVGLDSLSLERSCSPPGSMKLQRQRISRKTNPHSCVCDMMFPAYLAKLPNKQLHNKLNIVFYRDRC